MAEAENKWWHVADKDVNELVADLGGSNPFGLLRADSGLNSGQTTNFATAAAAASRPPKPRISNSPRPRVESDSTLAFPGQRVAESPRPRVLPGTPLLTNRSSPTIHAGRSVLTPRRCLSARRPPSARRTPTPRKSDDSMIVFVYNMHSADTLRFCVSPDLRIGLGEAVSRKDSLCQGPNVEETRYAQEFSNGGLRSCCDVVATESTFKHEIARVLGVEATAIRLMIRGAPVIDDGRTLRCAGITEGDTVHMRLRRSPSSGSNEVLLSCAAKKVGQLADFEKTSMLGMRPYALQPESRKSRLDQRCSDNGVALMPKWVSQEHPKLFAPVGIGGDGHGNFCPYENFNLQGIWIPPVDHPNQRGQNHYGLQRVREGCHANYGGA